MDSLFVRAQQYRPGDSSLGRSFRLSEDVERSAKSKHLDAIQTYAQREIGPDDVHVRGMLLCNSQRDYYYSRFTRDALAEVADLVPGAPVMTGHDYRLRPDARFFDARVVRIEDPSLPKRDQYWTECLYYVPKDATGDEYVRRVDLGIYREVSIGFRLASTPCSVCKKPIWACEHIPGEVYDRAGICEWGMEAITSVLEGSQVFRGGQKDTTNFVPEGYGDGERFRSAFVEGTTDVDPRLMLSLKRANSYAVKRGLSIEEFLASEEGERAVGMGAMFGKRGERSNTQAVLCAKSRFADPKRAARWVRDNDFRADRKRETDSSFVFDQFDENLVESGTSRSIALDEGVSARVGRVKSQKPEDEQGRLDEGRDAGESVEEFLSR